MSEIDDLRAQVAALTTAIQVMSAQGQSAAIVPISPEERRQPMLNNYGQFRPEALEVSSDGTRRPPRTLVSHGEQWLDKRIGSVRDVYNEINRFKKHVATHEVFAERPIWEIRDFHIEDFLAQLSETKSEQTVRHVLRIIRQIFADAKKRHLVGHNPCEGVKVPKQARTEEPWTYLEQSEIILVTTSDALKPKERQANSTAIYTGLREGEMKYLNWNDVHLEGSRPHVVVRYSNGGASKNGQVGRTPLLPMAIETFREIAQTKNSSGLVFPNPRGVPYSKGYDFGWRDKEGRAGSKTRSGITRRVRFHDLRHTCAAALVSGYWGDPWRLEEVKEFMRHSDIKITQRYAHLNPEGLHAKARAMADSEKNGVAEGIEILADDLPSDTPEKDSQSLNLPGRPQRGSNSRYRRERPMS